jgi:hypothetical protein
MGGKSETPCLHTNIRSLTTRVNCLCHIRVNSCSLATATIAHFLQIICMPIQGCHAPPSVPRKAPRRGADGGHKARPCSSGGSLGPAGLSLVGARRLQPRSVAAREAFPIHPCPLFNSSKRTGPRSSLPTDVCPIKLCRVCQPPAEQLNARPPSAPNRTPCDPFGPPAPPKPPPLAARLPAGQT